MKVVHRDTDENGLLWIKLRKRKVPHRLTYVQTRVKIKPWKGDIMKASELTRLIKKNGCYLLEHGKEHDKWHSDITGKNFMVPRHGGKEIAVGTANRILKDAGLK